MNSPRLRRILLGASIGIIVTVVPLLFILASPALTDNDIATTGGTIQIFIVGLLMGGLYAFQFRRAPDSDIENLMSGFMLGVTSWLVFSLTLIPLFSGAESMWRADAIVGQIPYLLVHVLQGGLIGVIYGRAYQYLAERLQLNPPPVPFEFTTQVIVVGGGYAGVSAAQALEKELAHHPNVRICLVSQTNYLLHTPMLSEVSSSAVDAQHIAPSLRSFFRRVQVVQGTAERVDLKKKILYLAAHAHAPVREMPYDHLVLAVGGVPNFFGNAGVEAEALTFKSLEDAIYLRNRLIDMFEHVDAHFADPSRLKTEEIEKQRPLLSFVVAGGGFAGVELIGGLNDFARGMLPYYPNIPLDCLRIILVHSRGTILPELSESLGKYAHEKLVERGVEFKLNTRVMGAEPGKVLLGDGKEIKDTLLTNTFVWTAGNRPHPLMDALGLDLNRRGQLPVNPELNTSEADGLWAVGDCAEVPDLITGKTCPPTAQYSLRQGKVVGYNVATVIKGGTPKPFKHKTQGSLAAKSLWELSCTLFL
ncbi:MAG: NAD(P)/FAD-dependent oxidoreductase [Chloroflexota bacterium]